MAPKERCLQDMDEAAQRGQPLRPYFQHSKAADICWESIPNCAQSPADHAWRAAGARCSNDAPEQWISLLTGPGEVFCSNTHLPNRERLLPPAFSSFSVGGS